MTWLWWLHWKLTAVWHAINTVSDPGGRQVA